MLMNCFIIMFNRLTWPRKMAEFLSDTGCEVILVDNASTYPPLLEWYDSCPYKVYRLQENYGHLVLWGSGIINNYKDRHYIVTDPDLDLSGVPHDYVDFLMKGFLHEEVVKVGLSLRVNDLPVNEFTRRIVEHEERHWRALQEDGFYAASVDTTFAIYDRERMLGQQVYWSLRSPEPYMARHLPWYLGLGQIPFEELYYMTKATEVSTFLRMFWEMNK
jgi:hypothetical protein